MFSFFVVPEAFKVSKYVFLYHHQINRLLISVSNSIAGFYVSIFSYINLQTMQKYMIN